MLPASLPPLTTTCSCRLLCRPTPVEPFSCCLLCRPTPVEPCSNYLLCRPTPVEPCSHCLLCRPTPVEPCSHCLLCGPTPVEPCSRCLPHKLNPAEPCSQHLHCKPTPAEPYPLGSSLSLSLPSHTTGTLAAAQLGAEQAVPQVLATLHAGTITLSGSRHRTSPISPTQPFSQATIHTSSYSAGALTISLWVYQPCAVTTQMMSTLKAACATAASQLGPSSSHFAPLSGTIPSTPAKFITAAAAGEFVDFNELLHAIEVNRGRSQPCA